MKREDWERIGSLFDEALKLNGAERDEFISNLGDEDLEQELRSLLAAHEDQGAFDELQDYVSGPEARRLLRLAPGDQIGPYRIVRELGSGGMATVYQADDLKHERQVAIKVLRPELAAVLGGDRFLHEISTTARLQHPHILPLLDSGQAEGLLYYVMPYIEGETLRDKLKRERQLGIEEAVRIATEVADALDYAHRHDVIHRDIKPENILLHEGRPLVADFGIALALSAAAGGRITETGLSLGTPQYMSPEQATAEKDLTHRSDIYALGCVLYEMLTGEPPHTGASAQQIMRKVVTDEATPITELRKSVPPNVAAAAAKSLEKLPADRFASARSFAEALTDPTFTMPTTGIDSIVRSRNHWKQLAVAFVAIALVTTVAGVWGWLRSANLDVDRPTVAFYLDPPAAMSFSTHLVLSPDGRRLVAPINIDDGSVLYQRMLETREWEIIPGTEGAYAPFFSPDGEWLGFGSSQDGSIKKVPVAGGSVQTIARIDAPIQGASWGPDNTLVFSSTESASGDKKLRLFRVAADGGVPEELTTPDRSLQKMGPRDPSYLPSGDVVFFTDVNTQLKPTVAALSLVSGRVSRLTPGMTPVADRTGRVLYVTADGAAMAQTFNPLTLSLEGSPKRIAEGIATTLGFIASYTVSSDGSLAFLSEPDEGDQLMLVSRSGEARPLFSTGVGSSLGGPRFSPSGDRIAFSQDGDVWVYSLAQGTAQRLSFERPATDPAWTTDGRFIGYSVVGEADGSFASLYRRAADGTGSAEQMLACGLDIYQVDFAAGDSEVVFYSSGKVYRASLNSDAAPVPLIETGSFLEHPTLSPDGRWLAYKSNESGCNEVYVRSYPDMGPPTIVSTGCGGAPAWSADGSEIFYWGPNGITAVSVRYDGPRITVVDRAELFSTESFRWFYNRNYDVHPDGQQFVMVSRPKARAVVRVNGLAE